MDLAQRILMMEVASGQAPASSFPLVERFSATSDDYYIVIQAQDGFHVFWYDPVDEADEVGLPKATLEGALAVLEEDARTYVKRSSWRKKILKAVAAKREALS